MSAPGGPERRSESPYDLVLLDADGTLLDFDAAQTEAFGSALGEAVGRALGRVAGQGRDVDFDRVFRRYREINHGIWAELERGEIDKETLKVERFRRLFSEFSIDASAAATSERYLALLSEGAQALAGAEDFVRSLLAAGLSLAIVTNGVSSVQRGRFSRSPLGALVPNLFISEELGAEKPDPAFFAEVFRRLHRPDSARSSVAVMGDSWSADVEGARRYGLDALWFNPGGAPRPDSGTGPDPEAGERPRLGGSRVFEVRSYEEARSLLLSR